ncbi:MAG: helix-turn-helix domain-containing protein [Flavitalea sp.]
MSTTDKSNYYFELADRFVNQTNRHIFLTGKAGTGKTTFLRFIQQNTHKKMVVVAPTGVAAINAGGVTLHSFFQLPFGPFIPSENYFGEPAGSANFNTPRTLFKKVFLSTPKRDLMRELELLIIDEVSMMRADLLDMVDLILRNVRRQPNAPFGGVQVLYIGDLFQLPPVVNNEEWNILKEYYKSPFFFDSKIVEQSPPLYLELKKIYRQHDEEFITILNNIRNNQTTDKDLLRLHQHFQSPQVNGNDEKCIILTTHNWKADSINQNKLRQLQEILYEFRGNITGDFNEKVLPIDMTLQLKEGAQVMFIKNDKGESRRYYNGKLAIISKVNTNTIHVKFPGEEGEMEIEKEVWKNIKYNYSREHNKIEEEEIGTYTQYPIRLAWAITIHKSQGLTFQKAIIDAGESFAPGQVYVALSRLVSLEGLILHSRIHKDSIQTNERVLEFTRLEKSQETLQQELHADQKVFISKRLLQSFEWKGFANQVQEHYEEYERRQIPGKSESMDWAKKLLNEVLIQQELAEKFTKQLEQLLPTAFTDDYHLLHTRISAANGYFSKSLDNTLTSLRTHIKEVAVKAKMKKYVKALNDLATIPQRKKNELEQAVMITSGLVKGEAAVEVLEKVEEHKKLLKLGEEEKQIVDPVAKKPAKGETFKISLQLFKAGNDIATIAKLRSLAATTIESHLVKFITTGEVKIDELVPSEKMEHILKLLNDPGIIGTGMIRSRLGDHYSYGEINAVINHRNRLQNG